MTARGGRAHENQEKKQRNRRERKIEGEEETQMHPRSASFSNECISFRRRCLTWST
jgi:hypothetical protein